MFDTLWPCDPLFSGWNLEMNRVDPVTLKVFYCQSTCKVCFSVLFPQAAAWLEEPEARSMFAWIEQKEDTKRIVQATLSRTGWPCMACHGMPWHAQKNPKRYTGTIVSKYVYIYIDSMYIPTLANMGTWIYSIYSMLIQCDVGVNSCTALTCHHKKEDCCVREPHGRSLASANQNRRPLCQRAQFRWTGEIMVSWGNYPK